MVQLDYPHLADKEAKGSGEESGVDFREIKAEAQKDTCMMFTAVVCGRVWAEEEKSRSQGP